MDWKSLKLLGSNILIERTPTAGVESSIIIIPDTSVVYDKLECKVLAVGPGEILSNGEREPVPVKPGDKACCWPGYGEGIGDSKFIVDVSMLEALVT